MAREDRFVQAVNVQRKAREEAVRVLIDRHATEFKRIYSAILDRRRNAAGLSRDVFVELKEQRRANKDSK